MAVVFKCKNKNVGKPGGCFCCMRSNQLAIQFVFPSFRAQEWEHSFPENLFVLRENKTGFKIAVRPGL
jgi:hypothetical protein